MTKIEREDGSVVTVADLCEDQVCNNLVDYMATAFINNDQYLIDLFANELRYR